MDLINHPKLLQRMHELAAVGDDPRHTFDMFLAGISGVVLNPTERKPFAASLESAIEQWAGAIQRRLGWVTVNGAVCIYPEQAEIDSDGILHLPSFTMPYTRVLANRELRQQGTPVPTTEIAIGAYSIPIVKFNGSSWAIYVIRPTARPDIAGSIQGAATGQLIESDLNGLPFNVRLQDNCRSFANLDPRSMRGLTLLGFDGSKNYWNDSQATYVFRAEPLSSVEPVVRDSFDALARVAGGFHKLDMPWPTAAVRAFGPILDLGKPAKKNHRVIGLPTTGLETFFQMGGQHHMASYTPIQTARLLLDPNPTVQRMLYPA